jgi:hypothetical protein
MIGIYACEAEELLVVEAKTVKGFDDAGNLCK